MNLRSRTSKPAKDEVASITKKATKTPSPTKKAPKEPPPPPTSTPVDYEFGGPIGSLLTMLLLPVVIFLLYYSASSSMKFNLTNYTELIAYLRVQDYSSLLDFNAMVVVVGWFLSQVLLERVLPFKEGKGVKLANGEQLSYRISAHLQLWIVFLVLSTCYPVFSNEGEGKLLYLTHFPLAYLYDIYPQLAMATIIFSTVLSVYLYISSFVGDNLLALGGNTRNVIYDFFIGRELNPRVGKSFDLKEFCELRPGLVGWGVLNAGCMLKQYEMYQAISLEMLLVNIFQGVYIWDALYNETAILTTMDITSDGFGFMLAFGDLAWVPFTYSLQARYLVDTNPNLSHTSLIAIALLNGLGYFIFRSSNSEKDLFRSSPDSPYCAHLKTLTTKTGRKLLISGWWGIARKINYTGDWLMGLSWCLLTGTDCTVTYFYAIYFAVLLCHRGLRDDHSCGVKYGEDWGVYKGLVPFVFIPGVV